MTMNILLYNYIYEGPHLRRGITGVRDRARSIHRPMEEHAAQGAEAAEIASYSDSDSILAVLRMMRY